jgi:AraC-like DNA-binding protein
MIQYNPSVFNIVTLFFLTVTGIAQNNVAVDSLVNKNFSQLNTIISKNIKDSNIKIAKQIAVYTLDKAKKEANFEAIAKSYLQLHFTVDDLSLAEKYIDSSIQISKEYTIKQLENEGYYYKGLVNFNLGNQEEAISLYIKARTHFKDKNDIFYNRIQHSIGFLKLRVGEYREAAQIFKENAKFKIDTTHNLGKKENYGSNLYGLGLAYVGLKEHDSATRAFFTGVYYANKHHYKFYTPELFQKEEAINDFYRKDYLSAKYRFFKVLSYFKSKKLYADLSQSFFYLGKIEQFLGNTKNSIICYKRVDSLYTISGYLIPEFRDAYKGLLDYYKGINNSEKQLYYTNRLLEIDSIIHKEFRFIVKKLHQDYDTNNLIAERDQLLKRERTNSKAYYILFSMLLAITCIGFVFNFYKRKKDKKRFMKLINTDHTTPSEIPKQKFKSEALEINDDIIDRVLSELHKFENKKGFLNKKLTLSTLSKKIKTNPKYLSKIINTHKHKSFRSYINDLRIQYILDCLKNESKFKKYTVKAISEEAGFSNPESFTKAFKKQTELTVSYFLKRVNQTS